MKQAGKFLSITGILLFTMSYAVAQVQVRLSADKNIILIGEPIKVDLEAYVPLGSEVNWFNTDSFPHFEYISKPGIDTTQSIEARHFSQQLTITSFDSGRWVIPPLRLTVDGISYYTDTLGISVGYSSSDPAEDYRDINEIELVEDPFAKWIPWGIALITVIAIALLTYILKRKKPIPHPVKKEEPVLSPYEEALYNLKLLKEKSLVEHNRIKEYYTELNDILRKYLGRKMQASLNERTNEEMILHLSKRGLPGQQYTRLAQVLRMADFVKFAKYTPGSEENEESYHVIETTIHSLNNLSQ